MRLIEKRKEFEKSKLSKWEFAHQMMGENHHYLWEYAEYISDTDIEEIRITKDGVFFDCGDGVVLTCIEGDERSMPMDIINFHSYEKSNMEIIEKVLDRVAASGTFFDIGANIGYTSIRWAKKFPNCKVFSFELMPKTFEILKKNVQKNGVANQVNIYNVGVADSDKKIECYYYPWVTANSSLENIQDRADAEVITADCVALDLFKEISSVKVDYIKIDVEGAELPAFKGMKEILNKNRPVVVAELLRTYSAKHGYHPNEVLELFREMGYCCIGLDDYRLDVVDDMSSTEYRNFMFLNEEKHRDVISMLLNN